MSVEWIDSKKRYILYVIICLAYLSNGLDISLVGPAVPDLAALMGTSESNVTYGFSIRSFANGVGCLIACYSFSKFSRQFQYTLSILVYGVGTICLPYLKGLWQYFLLSACFGFSNAMIDISTNLFVLELFQVYHLNVHVQCVHFSLAIGQTLGPLLLGPFLADSNRSPLTETGNQSLVFDTTTVSDQHAFAFEKASIAASIANQTLPDEIARTTAIFVPFTFGGSLFVACGVAMAACWFIKPYVPPERSIDGKDADRARREVESKEDEKQILMPNNFFYAIFVFLSICLISIEQTMEYQFLYFISMFLKHYLGIEGTENTNRIAMVGLAYIVGRGLNVLASALKIPATITLYLNVILLFAGSILIAFYTTPSSHNLSTLVSVGVILMGLGYSSCLPGMYVFIEQRINITTTLNSLTIAIQTALFCIESYRMGTIINRDPSAFKHMNLIYTIIFAFIFLLLHLTDVFKKYFLTTKKLV